MTRQGRSWVVATVAIAVWLGLLCLAVLTWDDFVEATGDTVDECDRGRCGALGEFTDDHPLALLLLLTAGAAIPAVGTAWLLGRLFHGRQGRGLRTREG